MKRASVEVEQPGNHCSKKSSPLSGTRAHVLEQPGAVMVVVMVMMRFANPQTTTAEEAQEEPLMVEVVMEAVEGHLMEAEVVSENRLYWPIQTV